jgi:hypothetical protein
VFVRWRPLDDQLFVLALVQSALQVGPTNDIVVRRRPLLAPS